MLFLVSFVPRGLEPPENKILYLFLTSFRFGHVMIPDLFHLFTKSRGLRQPMDGNDVCFAHNLFK